VAGEGLSKYRKYIGKKSPVEKDMGNLAEGVYIVHTNDQRKQVTVLEKITRKKKKKKKKKKEYAAEREIPGATFRIFSLMSSFGGMAGAR